MTSIYVLRLEQGKWYVGRSLQVYTTYAAHHLGNAIPWTQQYPPIRVEETIPSTNGMDEDHYVKNYMIRYGIPQVRGGSYTDMVLSEGQMTLLEREIRTARDVGAGHCENGWVVIEPPRLAETQSTSWWDTATQIGHVIGAVAGAVLAANEAPRDQGTCFRCGRHGHWVAQCYARSHVSGRPL
jgi:hypothetical protein